MKVRCVRKPLPRCLSKSKRPGVLLERDLRVRKHSRLFAKLLVFDTPKNLWDFWRWMRPEESVKGCLGCVNGLGYESIKFSRNGEEEKPVLCVDRRYFCVIGLTKKHLSMEIICHEAMHAGFCYAKRRRGDLWAKGLELDEENVCYPAGIIAAGINRVVHAAGLYEE